MLTLQDFIDYTNSLERDDLLAGSYLHTEGACGCLGVQVLRFRYPGEEVRCSSGTYCINDLCYDMAEAVSHLCDIWYSQFDDLVEDGFATATKGDWIAFLREQEGDLDETTRVYLYAVVQGV